VVEAGGLNWITTRPGYEDFRAILPWVVEHQEEPFGSPSICMQTFVMRAARENGVVVLLDGQGGDETLLGYERFHAAYCLMLWRTQGVRELLRAVQQTRLNSTMTARRLAAYGVFEFLPYTRHLYYRRRSSYLAFPAKLPEWVGEFSNACFDLRRLQALEIETITLPSLLRYEDKNSMGFSIEARLPFLDYRLVEKSIALAPEFKIRDGWTKWMLRRSMSDILPREIAWRRDKIGFAAPTELWLARHLERMIEAIRGSALLKRFCDFDQMTKRFGALDRNSQWRLYSLALWEEMFSVAA
jgi:asparagine synthase (glutamine-hydrolysing)